MVTCLIMQKTETALATSFACNYEGGMDMSQQYLWPKDKAKDQSNKSMLAIVTIFCTRF